MILITGFFDSTHRKRYNSFVPLVTLQLNQDTYLYNHQHKQM